MNDEYLIYGETLTAIANSIRSISSVSTTWTPDEMAAYILANLVKPTTRQAAKTYIPSTSNQTIPAGTFLTGAATITGEPNYVEGNIKKGTKMWNKTGTLSGIFGDPSAYANLSMMKSGSVTISNMTSNTWPVTHNLGVIPKLIVWNLPSANLSNAVKQDQQGGVYIRISDTFWLCYIFGFGSGGRVSFHEYWVNLNGTVKYNHGITRNIDPTTTTFNLVQDTSYFNTYGTYKWIAIA